MHCALYSTVEGNLFIHQARGVLPGPSRVSDRPVSTENVVYKAFVFWGKLDVACFYCLSGGKRNDWKTRRMTNGLAFTFLFCKTYLLKFFLNVWDNPILIRVKKYLGFYYFYLYYLFFSSLRISNIFYFFLTPGYFCPLGPIKKIKVISTYVRHKLL